MNDHTVEDDDLTLEGLSGPMVCEEDRLEECMNMDENDHYSKENTILTPMCEHAVCEKNDHTVMTRMKNRGKLKFREYCAECDMGDETMIGEEGRLCLSLLFAVKAEQKFGSVSSAQGQHSSNKYCSKTLKRKWGKRGRHVQWIVPLKNVTALITLTITFQCYRRRVQW